MRTEWTSWHVGLVLPETRGAIGQLEGLAQLCQHKALIRRYHPCCHTTMDRSISVDTIHMSHSDSRQHDDTNWHDEAAQICMSKSPKKLQLELETQRTYRCSQRATWSEEVTLLAIPTRET